MRPIAISMSALTASATNVAASQTPDGAGSLTINGTRASGGIVTFLTPQLISITSAADISNRTFTIAGTDMDGNSVTETGLTGPNAATIPSVKYFYSVTGMTISGAAAGAITVGNSGLATSKPIPLDLYAPVAQVSVNVTAVSAGTYKMQYTFDDVQATTWPNGTQNWTDDSAMTGKTAAFSSSITVLPRAVRIVITTAGTNPVITGNVIQPGY